MDVGLAPMIFWGSIFEPGAIDILSTFALIPMGDWCGSVPQPQKRKIGCVDQQRMLAQGADILS
nr:hypothetical protein [Paraburkholderia sp. BL8N3]